MNTHQIDLLQPSAANGSGLLSAPPMLLPGLAGVFAGVLEQQQALLGEHPQADGLLTALGPQAGGALFDLLHAASLEQALLGEGADEGAQDAALTGETGVEALLAALRLPGLPVQSDPTGAVAAEQAAGAEGAANAVLKAATPDVAALASSATGDAAAVAQTASQVAQEQPASASAVGHRAGQSPNAMPEAVETVLENGAVLPPVVAAVREAPAGHADGRASQRAVAAMRALNKEGAPPTEAVQTGADAKPADPEGESVPSLVGRAAGGAVSAATGAGDAGAVVAPEGASANPLQTQARNDAAPMTGVERTADATQASSGSGRIAAPTLPEPPPERSTLQALSDSALKSIRYLTSGDQKSLHIRMVPESLGEVRVEVSSFGDSKGLQIRLTSANPAVREALEGQMAGLRDALQRDGMTVGRMVVSADASPHQSASDGMPGRHAAFSGHGRGFGFGQQGPGYDGGDEPAPGFMMRQRVVHHGALDVLA